MKRSVKLQSVLIKHCYYTLQAVNREMKVKASNCKEYYLVEVIAHILKYLKDELIRLLKLSHLNLEATDFDWVITVPAIWKAKGKQMMREAGYKVGINMRTFQAHTHGRLDTTCSFLMLNLCG